LLSQSPIVCLAVPSPMFPHRLNVCYLHPNHTHYRRGPSNESPKSPNPHTMWAGHGSRGAP